MKVYANHLDAELALAKQADMFSCTMLHDSCSVDGICIIVYYFIEHSKKVTSNQVINLATQVNKLYKRGSVNCCLRIPNILF
jgi:hypothetical protein